MNYQPLDATAGEFRLLTIQPADNEDDQIESRLDHESFGSLPPYGALSYCWGDPQDTRPILINGHRFNATANLYAALVRMRSEGIGRLWIDAICINQADLDEKAKQISMMGSIYQKAQHVHAWTGPDDEDSTRVLDIIGRYGTRTPVSTSPASKALTTLPATKPPVTTETGTLAPLSNFLRRAYWGRVWIIQEVVLAKSVMLHLGRHTIDWETFCAAVVRIMEEVKMPPAEIALYQNVDNLIGLRRDVAKNPIPLIRALRQTWMAKATEPRDKVFGLLSMVFDQRDYMAAPTYRGSLEDLCQSMTLEHISIQRSLNLVALLGRGYETAPSATRPSWCPEFFTLDGDARYRQLLTLTAGEERPWRRSKLFNYRFSASGDSRSVPSHLQGVLTCKALPVGALAMAGRSGAKGSESPRPAFGTSEGLPTPYPDKSVFNVFLETLLWGFPVAPVRNYWVYNLIYHTEVLRMWRSAKYRPAFGDKQTQAWIDDHRDFRFQGRSLQEWCRWQSWHGSLRTRNKAAKRRQDELFAYVRHFVLPDLARVVGLGMRLMLTTEGRLGWAPCNAQLGDLLYILRGCDVPVVLRRREQGGYVLVGDAFIYGVMKGQAVDGLDKWPEEVEIY
jgi:hypothetical protein